MGAIEGIDKVKSSVVDYFYNLSTGKANKVKFPKVYADNQTAAATATNYVNSVFTATGSNPTMGSSF